MNHALWSWRWPCAQDTEAQEKGLAWGYWQKWDWDRLSLWCSLHTAEEAGRTCLSTLVPESRRVQVQGLSLHL